MRKFAVLLSGGVNAGSNYSRYLNDLQEMYRALVDKNGYAKSDIFVLYADGSAHDLDGDGNSEIHSGCSLTELNTLFQSTLPPLITSQDMLFIFATNHGGLTNATTEQAKLWLWGGSIEDSQFAALVNALNFKYLAVCMEQCYSGGFINDLAGSNRVIATACRHDEVSWACDSEGNYDEFCYYWTAAIRSEKPGGQAISADMDGDGKVSLKDAFDYAKSNDSRTEHPQYYESPAGLGSQLTLSGLLEVIPCFVAPVRPCGFGPILECLRGPNRCPSGPMIVECKYAPIRKCVRAPLIECRYGPTFCSRAPMLECSYGPNRPIECPPSPVIHCSRAPIGGCQAGPWMEPIDPRRYREDPRYRVEPRIPGGFENVGGAPTGRLVPVVVMVDEAQAAAWEAENYAYFAEMERIGMEGEYAGFPAPDGCGPGPFDPRTG